ncbi:MAG: VWA domain-containing protein [Burkholderiales bacterium]|nr:VWA domain-containing protein [Burkholderiales bacterium]
MTQRPPSRMLVAALAAQLLLVACSATAHTPQGQWPEPQPQPWPEPTARSTPNFNAPSATHCSRPVAAREVPGWQEGWGQARSEHAIRRDGRGRGRMGPADFAAPAEKSAADAAGALAAAPPPASVAAPLAKSEGRAAADMAGSARNAAPTFAQPQFVPPQPPQQQMPPRSQVVTAGVVDDNADFTSYLAFRDRTRVDHRQRDVRERYLLEVKDHRGRGIADAEVAVQAPTGFATWARTDTGGRVWLHPNAFDPSYSHSYEVAVRKDGRMGYAQLQRGQRSSVEVRLDARAALPRAKLDLVFLIDATGSMADEIHKLKSSLRAITAEVARLPSQPDLCLGLVAYRDRGDAFLLRSHDFTNDVGGFLRDALIPLQAGGGGDYPEAMNEALHETVHKLNWRGDGATRMVVLLADAPPHLDYGAPHYDDDMMAALGRGIKVFSVGASGLDKQGEFIQRQIAQYTGGRFVFLTYADAHNPRSGPGRETVHEVKNYSVDTLDRLIVRLVTEELAKLSP